MENELIQELLKTFGGESILIPVLLFVYLKLQNIKIDKAKLEFENKYLKEQLERLK